MILSIMAAYAKNEEGERIIGKGNKLPWHFPHDLERFKEYTQDSAIIMGRKTHEAIGRVLPRRDNIIVTRQRGYVVPGAFVFNTLNDAVQFASKSHPEVFIIGGQQLFEQAIDKADRLYLTSFKIDGIEGDTYFPTYVQGRYKLIHSEKAGISGDCFRILERRWEKDVSEDDGRYGRNGAIEIDPPNTVNGIEDDWPPNSAYYWDIDCFAGWGYGV